MKGVALVFNARKKGNCYDFARFMVNKLEKRGVETEIINFCDYNIKPCQNCDYECLRRIDPKTGRKEYGECPFKDDVADIWRKVWNADIFDVCSNLRRSASRIVCKFYTEISELMAKNSA